MDDDGYVWYQGRHDDVLNLRGHRVSALEVERVMAEHPGVADVAVAETPRADGVRLLTAYVVPGTDAPDPDALRAWTADRLGAYKCPKLIRWVGPATGKLVRARLCELPERDR